MNLKTKWMSELMYEKRVQTEKDIINIYVGMYDIFWYEDEKVSELNYLLKNLEIEGLDSLIMLGLIKTSIPIKPVVTEWVNFFKRSEIELKNRGLTLSKMISIDAC
jgi:hypothetical protein